ncbi:MAG: hypothetical protein P4L26_14440 [Terracidiphilus sp.]|nr:hypothetical protein [Terracidiphilus sp.]
MPDEIAQSALETMVNPEIEPAFSLTSPIPISTLQEVIASGWVIAEFSGIGGSSGDSVLAELAKGAQASAEPLRTSLPVGSVLLSDDGSVQNMMVAGVRGILHDGSRYRPETRIVLTDSDAVVYVLAAYCMEFEKESPSQDTRFRLERPDPALERIAQLGASLTVPAMQAAVWMHTDSITYWQMNEKFPISKQDWASGQSVFLKSRIPPQTISNDISMLSRDERRRVPIKPEEDARIPILEAQIEREWRQYRRAYVKSLQKAGQLQKQVHETALWCVQVLRDAENRGLNPDQGRELMQPLIHPQWDRS